MLPHGIPSYIQPLPGKARVSYPGGGLPLARVRRPAMRSRCRCTANRLLHSSSGPLPRQRGRSAALPALPAGETPLRLAGALASALVRAGVGLALVTAGGASRAGRRLMIIDPRLRLPASRLRLLTRSGRCVWWHAIDLPPQSSRQKGPWRWPRRSRGPPDRYPSGHPSPAATARGSRSCLALAPATTSIGNKQRVPESPAHAAGGSC
jgi:hypothetical protein